MNITKYSRKQKQILTWWMDGSPVKDKDFIAAEGAIRSGKTLSTIESFVNWSQTVFSNQNFIIAGVSVGAVKRNVLEPMWKLLDMKGISYQWHNTDKRLTIGSNHYYVFGANTDYSQDSLQGLTAAGSFIDEVPLVPRSFVEQAIGRCSVAGAKNWYTLNPSTPFHWFKTEMLEKLEERNGVSIHFLMDDNPSLDEDTINRYKRMFSGLFYKRYIEGLWVVAEGAIYDMFDKDKHVVKAPQTRDFYDETWCAVDYATSSVMTFGLYGRKDKTVYLIKEYYWDAVKEKRQKTDVEYARELKAFYDGWNPSAIYVDPSASSFQATLRYSNVQKVRSAKNDVISGIRCVSSMLQEGRYLIDEDCKATLSEIQTYSWDKRAQELGDDKPVKKNDHAMDRDRYALYTHLMKPSRKAINKPKGL